MGSYLIKFYSEEKKRIIEEFFISNCITDAVKDIEEELGVKEAEIIAVVLLES